MEQNPRRRETAGGADREIRGRRLLWLSALATGLLAATSAAAPAQAQFVDVTDTATVMRFAEKIGSAEIVPLDNGTPRIKGRTAGYNYDIQFSGCEDNKNCRDIMFSSGFEVDGVKLATMTKFNGTQLYARAYLSRKGDAFLELPVSVHGGITEANMTRYFERWRVALKDFAAATGYEK
ncbi:MAG: YbjN domain-containing protein [Hyphomicrobiaceae bacterium]|nr:YbjN domain-containing protein [Hyphomicrobiaceae bacterium]